MVRVAIDVMGGDAPPVERVAAGVAAARDGDIEVVLVGVPDIVEAALTAEDVHGLPISVVPSGPAIAEGEQPALALHRRPDASVAVAAGLVKSGAADAVVSIGNTGASMAAAQIMLGTLPGVERISAGGDVFGPLAPSTVLIDCGPNVDVRPQQLVTFAVLGVAYAREMLGIVDPTVALLANGAERGKGNHLVRAAYPLFEASGLRFIGQVEGHDLLRQRANVVVCDGFVGNVVIKFYEAVGEAVTEYLIQALGDRLPEEAARDMRGCVRQISSRTERGGPLLGVNGLFVVGHGAAHVAEVTDMIRVAARLARSGFVNELRATLAGTLGEVTQ